MDNQVALCEERHKNLDSRVSTHDDRLNIHGDRLDKLENQSVRSEVMIQNLCEQIKSLVALIKTVLLSCAGFIIVTLVGFLIWYIQKL